MATVANSAGEKLVHEKRERFCLTPTGLLMEGDYTHHPGSMSEIQMLLQILRVPFLALRKNGRILGKTLTRMLSASESHGKPIVRGRLLLSPGTFRKLVLKRALGSCDMIAAPASSQQGVQERAAVLSFKAIYRFETKLPSGNLSSCAKAEQGQYERVEPENEKRQQILDTDFPLADLMNRIKLAMTKKKQILTIFILMGLAILVAQNYLTRIILPAFNPSSSDFSELYASSWLWRQGQNPYDSMLATNAHMQVIGRSDEIFLVNAPTALVVTAPFTLLTWRWANILFLVLGMIGLATTVFALAQLRSPSSGLGAALIAVFVMTFSPVRIAFQWGNIALLVLPLSVLAIWLASNGDDWWSGLLLGLTICSKPQIGIWLAFYYLLRFRLRVASSCLVTCLVIVAFFFLHPIPYESLIVSYRTNLHHWFDPGAPYGFTEGANPLVGLRLQGIFYELTHSISASTLIAHTLFFVGLAVWGILVWRSGDRIPPPLAIVTLLALSFLSLYHSIPDASVLLISMCDALPTTSTNWTRTQKAICIVLFLILLPERSIFVFFGHYLSASVMRMWWWDLIVLRYLPWLLLFLSVALLLRMHELQASKPSVR